MKEFQSMQPEDDFPDTLPDTLNESLSRAIKPIELGAEQRDRLRQRVLQQARQATAQGTITIRSNENAWIEIAPLVEVRELHRDVDSRTHTSLMRMRPGGVIPPHRHSQDEEFIVLEGECHIGTHHLQAGDSHFAAAGSWHEAVTTRSGVLVMLRGEYPYPGAEHSVR